LRKSVINCHCVRCLAASLSIIDSLKSLLSQSYVFETETGKNPTFVWCGDRQLRDP